MVWQPRSSDFDHQLVGAGIVEEAFLREHADLQVDRPGIFLDQRQHAFEAAQPDARIDFKMRAHMRRALQDRLFQRARGAGMDVLGREAGLGFGSFGDRFVEIALLRLDPIEDAGLVEMDVGLDKAGRHQPPAEIDGLCLGRQTGLDRGDAARGDADVGQFAARRLLCARSCRMRSIVLSFSIARSQRRSVVAEIGLHQRRIPRDVARGSGVGDGAGL